MVWFKMDELPWETNQDMVLVHFDNQNLKCVVFRSKRADCFQSSVISTLFSLDLQSATYDSGSIL